MQPISVREFISRELALEKEVEAVLTLRHGNIFHIWTVVNDPDSEIRQRIFEREKLIIDEFGEYEFDFDIIARRNRSIDALLTETGVEVPFSRL